MLKVYSTTRAIRESFSSLLDENSLLPKTITIGEFEKKAMIIPNRIFIDDDTRILLLRKASEFSTFENLNISAEFFTFLQNSTFLFKFYEELANELVDISKLREVDFYAQFQEHIDILDQLLFRYRDILDENGYVDAIFSPSLYKLNSSYINTLDKIEFYQDGYLNNFEFKLFLEIAEIVPFKIIFSTNQFNKKMIEKYKELGFSLDIGYRYILDLSNRKILSKISNNSNTINYDITPIKNRVLQTAFVKKKVYDFISLGILPQKIAVILPNGSFAEYLELFDMENNFNFAMGSSYKKSEIYRNLSALYDFFLERSIENRQRLETFGYEIDQVLMDFKSWNKSLNSSLLKEKFESFISDEMKEDEVDIYKDELYYFSKLFEILSDYAFHKVLHLFLNRLSNKNIDDIRGGKITVMEVLETRGVTFDAVIVVDFNEDIVPAKSQKDLFLSTELRYHSNLPTVSDRENLQKYYYKQLFDRAKYVAISYVDDETNQPSRFLDELDIEFSVPSFWFSGFEDILFSSFKQRAHFNQDNLILDYDFFKIELSSSRLKTYLECKRKYYFKYIKKLKEAEVPKDEYDGRIVGVYIHEALKKLYEKRDRYFDKTELLKTLSAQLYDIVPNDNVLKFYLDIWIQKLNSFAQKEIDRFNEGFSVRDKEIAIKTDYKGFKLFGKIDRIDKKDEKLYIIDYKTGVIPKTTKNSLEKSVDFQLQFYYLLASNISEVYDACYYDLSNAKLVSEDFFEEKLQLLDKKLELLKDTQQNFTLTEEIKYCRYCPYTMICNRTA